MARELAALIERLRFSGYADSIQAADALEALLRRVEQAEREVVTLRNTAKINLAGFKQMKAERDTADKAGWDRAIGRAEAALRRLANIAIEDANASGAITGDLFRQRSDTYRLAADAIAALSYTPPSSNSGMETKGD